jgi:hypothetical protein
MQSIHRWRDGGDRGERGETQLATDVLKAKHIVPVPFIRQGYGR